MDKLKGILKLYTVFKCPRLNEISETALMSDISCNKQQLRRVFISQTDSLVDPGFGQGKNPRTR